MKAITITAGVIALVSGAAVVGAEVLIPPVMTAVFAVSAAVMIAGAVFLRRSEEA